MRYINRKVATTKATKATFKLNPLKKVGYVCRLTCRLTFKMSSNSVNREVYSKS